MLKKLLIGGYILFIVFSVGYCYKVLKLNKTTVTALSTDTSKSTKATRILLTLNVDSNNNVKTYTKKLTYPYTILALLDDLRSDDLGFSFEKTYYRHGIEIDKVNNISAPQGYKWQLFLNETPIDSSVIDTQMVVKNDIYDLKLIKL